MSQLQAMQAESYDKQFIYAYLEEEARQEASTVERLAQGAANRVAALEEAFGQGMTLLAEQRQQHEEKLEAFGDLLRETLGSLKPGLAPV